MGDGAVVAERLVELITHSRLAFPGKNRNILVQWKLWSMSAIAATRRARECRPVMSARRKPRRRRDFGPRRTPKDSTPASGIKFAAARAV
jgi:hypothetical protein